MKPVIIVDTLSVGCEYLGATQGSFRPSALLQGAAGEDGCQVVAIIGGRIVVAEHLYILGNMGGGFADCRDWLAPQGIFDDRRAIGILPDAGDSYGGSINLPG